MTSSPTSARFPARTLLKGVSLFLGALVFGLLAAVVIIPIARNDSQVTEVALFVGPVFLLPALYVLKMIVDSFSVLEVDEKGVRVRKWVGGVDLEWQQIDSVRYWEAIQVVHGAPSREYFAEIRGKDGKRLARLKSSYERPAYECLLECAKRRNIRVDIGRT